MADLGLDDTPLRAKKTPAAKKTEASSALQPSAPGRRSVRTADAPAPNYAEERVLDAEPKARGRKRGAAAPDSDSSSEEEDVDAPASSSAALSSSSAKPRLVLPVPAYDRQAAAAKFPGCELASGGVTRDGASGALRFQPAPGADADAAALVASFRPNRTPEEVLREGAFGGTYFRTIASGVAKATLENQWQRDLPEAWREGLNPKTHLCRAWKAYAVGVNKFGVKSGQTLEDWEASGWITPFDPFGWFQWYVRFFQGRRCADDARQVGRWLNCCGPTGRWKGNLCAKVALAKASFDDPAVSPVVRQTLLHWGYELTPQDYAASLKKLKAKGAYLVSKEALGAALGKGKKRAKK